MRVSASARVFFDLCVKKCSKQIVILRICHIFGERCEKNITVTIFDRKYVEKQHIYDTIIQTKTKILKKTARNFNFCLIFSPNAYRDSVKTQYTMYFFSSEHAA